MLSLLSGGHYAGCFTHVIFRLYNKSESQILWPHLKGRGLRDREVKKTCPELVYTAMVEAWTIEGRVHGNNQDSFQTLSIMTNLNKKPRKVWRSQTGLWILESSSSTRAHHYCNVSWHRKARKLQAPQGRNLSHRESTGLHSEEGAGQSDLGWEEPWTPCRTV